MRQHYEIHKEINADAIEYAADDRLGDQKPKQATSQVVDDRGGDSNQEVKDPAEHDHPGATREGALTEGSAGYRLQDCRGAGSALEITEDTGVSDIQSARDQAAEKTSQKRF